MTKDLEKAVVEGEVLDGGVAEHVSRLSGFSGNASLYKLRPPLMGYSFVVVSATNVLYSGPETYIFGADEQGEIVDWGELPGSYRGGLDHEEALEDAGYRVVSVADQSDTGYRIMPVVDP